MPSEQEFQMLAPLFSLLVRHHDLLANVVPAIRELRCVLTEGPASPEQLGAWEEKSDAFDKAFYEISAEFEALHASAFDGVATN